MSPGEIAARIDDEWDFNAPAETAARFEALLASDEAPVLKAQLLTQLARTHSLRRNFDEAHRLLDEAEAMLATEEPLVRVRYLLERGRTFNSSGERDAARPLFVEAYELADAQGADFYTVDAAHMVAIVESPDQAVAWNERGLRVAGRSEDERARTWEGSLCNNLGWTYHDRGEHERALALFERALQARQRQEKRDEVRIARWCIGRCLRSLGRLDDALDLQRALFAEHEQAGSRDGYVHEELAECLYALGRVEEACEHFRTAHELLSADPWLVESEPRRLERLQMLGK